LIYRLLCFCNLFL